MELSKIKSNFFFEFFFLDFAKNMVFGADQ